MYSCIVLYVFFKRTLIFYRILNTSSISLKLPYTRSQQRPLSTLYCLNLLGYSSCRVKFDYIKSKNSVLVVGITVTNNFDLPELSLF